MAVSLAQTYEALVADREAVSEQLAALSRDFEGIVQASRESNADDEHDPEGATIAFERSQVTALIEQARLHLDELDRAMERLRAGSYGVCERCGSEIGAERLEARPAARTCINCAR
jgi:DnaK suppressor protein